MVYFVGFLIFLLLGTGIFGLLADKWMYKLAQVMDLPLKKPSPIVRPIVKMGLWQLRLAGIFHFVLGILLFLGLIMDSRLFSELFWILVVFPIASWIILPLMITIYYFKNRKAIEEAAAENGHGASK